MTTRVLDINVFVVYSDPQTSPRGATLRTVEDTAETAAHNVLKIIKESIPEDRVCSLMLTEKDSEYEENGEDDDES